MDKSRVLIIVDFQKDFAKKDGSLYVEGAEKALENIKNYINENQVDAVIFTVDWHYRDDRSFKQNGGQWPVHCVQYSEGAGIVDELFKLVVVEKGLPYFVFTKGTKITHEEYGAFEERIEDRVSPDLIVTENYGHDCQMALGKMHEYVICGLAGDYCVYETYKNLKESKLDITPFYDGMAFIGKKFDFEEKYNSQKESSNEQG